MKFGRSSSPRVKVAAGEKILAEALAVDGTAMAGTRHAFYVATGVDTGTAARRVPWEQVEAADWDRDTETFRLSEVGTWGEERVIHTARLVEPTRLLELVRERVIASVVLQRHVALPGRQGFRVIARRAPAGDRPIEWIYEYDEGVDPADPVVVAAAREALELARVDVGMP